MSEDEKPYHVHYNDPELYDEYEDDNDFGFDLELGELEVY